MNNYSFNSQQKVVTRRVIYNENGKTTTTTSTTTHQLPDNTIRNEQTTQINLSKPNTISTSKFNFGLTKATVFQPSSTSGTTNHSAYPTSTSGVYPTSTSGLTKSSTYPTSLSEFNQFQIECLQAHNEYRRKHGVPSLQLNKSLCQFAQEWSQTIASKRQMQHRPGNKYGENIYWSSGRPADGRLAVKSWYDEIKDYSFQSAKFNMKTGHFTQVVWKNSTMLGVGMTQIGNEVYIVANYDPAGNFQGQFGSNVLSPTY